MKKQNKKNPLLQELEMDLDEIMKGGVFAENDTDEI